MNFHENLIAEMRKRPMLWNRYHDYYNSRPVTDREWDNIAKMFKKTKEFVKQKWRTLRDQFLRELKKVKIPNGVVPDKPLVHYYRGQWHYFEQMLFLRNAVTTRKTRSPSPEDLEHILLEGEARECEIKEDELKDGEIRECEVKIESEEWESGSESLHFNDFTEPNDTVVDKIVFPEVQMKETENSNEVSLPVTVIPPIIVSASTAVNADRKRKLSDFECLQTKTAKLNAEAEIDDDLHFVKSLVPFMNKLSSVRKLLVRNEIQNILIRETLCDHCKCTQDVHANSS